MKAEILEEWRKARGLTQHKAAEKLGCGVTTIKQRAKDSVVIDKKIYVPIRSK